MRLSSLGIAAALHAAALAAAGFVWIELPREQDVVWGDGRIDVALTEHETAAQAQAVETPALDRDVIPAMRPELIELPDALLAAGADETDVTLPEGGAPPPAPSICVDGGLVAHGRPRFSAYARPGAPIGLRLGRGRRGATGDGAGAGLVLANAAAPLDVVIVRPPEPELISARLLEHPSPRYPEAARSRRVQGVVRIEVEVLADGNVGEIRVLESSGSELLDDAAVAAVRRWKFAAATRGGEPVATVVTIPAIRFELR